MNAARHARGRRWHKLHKIERMLWRAIAREPYIAEAIAHVELA